MPPLVNPQAAETYDNLTKLAEVMVQLQCPKDDILFNVNECMALAGLKHTTALVDHALSVSFIEPSTPGLVHIFHYTFDHLKNADSVVSTDDAYDRAMRGI